MAEAAKTTAENDGRIVAHVSQALEAAQEDLASIGGSLGSGARDLGKDVQRLLRDARHDLKKMRKALRRDIERLQKELATDALKRGSAGGLGRRQTRAARRRARPASRGNDQVSPQITNRPAYPMIDRPSPIKADPREIATVSDGSP